MQDFLFKTTTKMKGKECVVGQSCLRSDTLDKTGVEKTRHIRENARSEAVNPTFLHMI